MLIVVLLATGTCRSRYPRHCRWAIPVILMGTNLPHGAMSQGPGFILLCLLLTLVRNRPVLHQLLLEGLLWDSVDQAIVPTPVFWRIVVGSLRECMSPSRPTIPVVLIPT